MNKNIEVISLIYKSVSYLYFIYEQLKNVKAEGWDVGFRIVANDPTEKVENAIKTLGAKYNVYKDQKPTDYYLNRVYRCWNYAGTSSKYDNICFVNSDMAFSDGWLTNLLKHHDGNSIPCSRLVESGKMPSGLYGISNNFGQNVNEINLNKWEKYAASIRVNEVHHGGLYMPCVISKQRFIESGMYPEGNIYSDGVGTLNSFIQSGDDWYFKRLNKQYGMKHITVFDSLVYHIQEGEKDE
jgi:hypothetical protein